ncbi:MAG: hypothetical protein GX303_03640 [Clostridiales bacterium]|nr:hypothetical protein [Clostridiales bacterium]
MHSIFNFEGYNPPELSEAMLKRILDRRKLERQTALLAVASGFLYLCFSLLAILLSAFSLTISLILVALIFISLSGGGVISVIFYKKRCESYVCQQ